MTPPGDGRGVELAAFDFDGTLTSRDTFVGFLQAVAGHRRLGLAGVGAATRAVRSPLASQRRDRLKAELCRSVLRGLRQADLRATGRRYADALLASAMRPDTLARLQWHRSQGHAVVIVSAGLDLYLDVIADRLGLDAVLASTVAFDGSGRATGDLVDGNCRGTEKARRLVAWCGQQEQPECIWAYGDSAGDAELLAMADHPVRVGRRPVPAAPVGPRPHRPVRRTDRRRLSDPLR